MNPAACAARRWLLGGQVQGVGFRPFVWRSAQALALCGWVRNLRGQVEVFAQGDAATLDRLLDTLLHAAPPLAEPHLLEETPVACSDLEGFAILNSVDDASARASVPSDRFVCEACLAELRDPTDRRHGYPFINCTQCGPRYTLIRQLPYDRARTSMADFALCARCQAEYDDPRDRRFHAEPLACPECGPALWFATADDEPVSGNAPALMACIAALRAGAIVAVRGVGGYHLLCDAANDVTLARLRLRKHRPHKPFAVMFPARGADGLDAVRATAYLDADEARWLTDSRRPVVWLQRRDDTALSAQLAPGLTSVGALLPYSPLHHLLLDGYGGPLVATSANRGGEPVLTGVLEAEQELVGIADAFLHHNREIVRPAEDSVIRRIAGHPARLRIGRGDAPLEVGLPFRLSEPLLALGGHMKNTVALAWDDRVVISPHIGDLDTPRGLAVFEQTLAGLQQLYGVEARRLVRDAHPGYGSSRWAGRQSLPVVQVWHHHAHASALAGEHTDVRRWLVFAWDGTGLGEDGELWGGDTLAGAPSGWQRVARLRPFRLPGGEQAIREPWRSAAGVNWECGRELPHRPQQDLLYQAWLRGLNCPRTTSAGRLFDAAAAISGVLREASFDAQAPLWLEDVADPDAPALDLPWHDEPGGLSQCDWSPLLPLLADASLPLAQRSGSLHASLARAICRQAVLQRERQGRSFVVGLCGGVFQNRLLVEHTMAALRRAGFDVRSGERVPVNDGGLSFGQVIEVGSQATS